MQKVHSLVDKVYARQNLKRASERVRANRGLATSDRVAIIVWRLLDGEMRVVTNSLGRRERVSRDQVFEVRNVGSRLHVARKKRRPDQWDPPIEPYDPYGPGVGQRALSDFDVITDDRA